MLPEIGKVTIPQAVSAVATLDATKLNSLMESRYNTASGKRCCNDTRNNRISPILRNVTIPQAVSAVATKS